MMDGVVLSDVDLLLDFDAMLLEDIDIYDQAFLCGKTPFRGLVNFITADSISRERWGGEDSEEVREERSGKEV